MKHLLAFFILLAALTAPAADVTFPFNRLDSLHSTNRKVLVTPLTAPGSWAGAENDGAPVMYNTGTNGSFTITNMAPGLYGVELQAPPNTLRFQILVRATDTAVTITNMTALGNINTFPPGAAAWSADASDARYAAASFAATNAFSQQFKNVNGTNFIAAGVGLTNPVTRLADGTMALTVGGGATNGWNVTPSLITGPHIVDTNLTFMPDTGGGDYFYDSIIVNVVQGDTYIFTQTTQDQDLLLNGTNGVQQFGRDTAFVALTTQVAVLNIGYAGISNTVDFQLTHLGSVQANVTGTFNGPATLPDASLHNRVLSDLNEGLHNGYTNLPIYYIGGQLVDKHLRGLPLNILTIGDSMVEDPALNGTARPSSPAGFVYLLEGRIGRSGLGFASWDTSVNPGIYNLISRPENQNPMFSTRPRYFTAQGGTLYADGLQAAWRQSTFNGISSLGRPLLPAQINKLVFHWECSPIGGTLTALHSNELNGAFTSYTLDGTTTPKTFANTSVIKITNAATAQVQSVPYPSSITASGLTGSVYKVSVTLSNLGFGKPSDLRFLLVGPDGSSTLLAEGSGGSSAITNVTLTFDDNGSAMPAPPVTGATYKPTQGATNLNFTGTTALGNMGLSLHGEENGGAQQRYADMAGFYGTSPNGTWSLYTVNANSNTNLFGRLDGWYLKIWTVEMRSTNFAVLGLSTNNAVFVSSTGTNTFLGMTAVNTNIAGVVRWYYAQGSAGMEQVTAPGSKTIGMIFNDPTTGTLLDLAMLSQINHDNDSGSIPCYISATTNLMLACQGGSPSNCPVVLLQHSSSTTDHGFRAALAEQRKLDNWYIADMEGAFPDQVRGTNSHMMNRNGDGTIDVHIYPTLGAMLGFGQFLMRTMNLDMIGMGNGTEAPGLTNMQTGVTLSGTFTGTGSGLTLSASQLTSGTIPDSRLSLNVVTNTRATLSIGSIFIGDASGRRIAITNAGGQYGWLGEYTGPWSGVTIYGTNGAGTSTDIADLTVPSIALHSQVTFDAPPIFLQGLWAPIATNSIEWGSNAPAITLHGGFASTNDTTGSTSTMTNASLIHSNGLTGSIIVTTNGSAYMSNGATAATLSLTNGNVTASSNVTASNQVATSTLRFTAVPGGANNGQPQIALNGGSALGTGGTNGVIVVAGGNDTRGTMVLTTGSASTAAGKCATLTFSATKLNPDAFGIIAAQSLNGGNLVKFYFTNFTTTTVDIYAAAAPVANTAYGQFYFLCQ